VGGVLEILGFARWLMSVRSDGVDPRAAALVWLAAALPNAALSDHRSLLEV